MDQTTDDVKRTLKARLKGSLSEAHTLLERAKNLQAPIEGGEQAWKNDFTTLHAASALFPIRPWHDCYQRDLMPATEPLFVGLSDDFNEEHFGNISDAFVKELRAKYETPAVAAIDAVFDTATTFFRKLVSQVLTLRYFSNSEALLKRFEAILEGPWSVSPVVEGLPKQVVLPFWLKPPAIYAVPPHIDIQARRAACVRTLRIISNKLEEASATLDTAILELPFADRLEQPAAVPQTLYDYSTNIGEGARIENAAVGQGASRAR